MTRIGWAALALLGAFACAVIATARGEAVNALWIVTAAVSVYLIAYRFYALYIARHVMRLDGERATPAVRRPDGLDYVPTNRYVLFGHHFAAIAGAGPLVGPVLAAQMGYLPGMLWILAGVVVAGAVQDFMVLFISMRRDGRSLGELIRIEMGPIPGTIALAGAFMIMVIILAVLALIVVRALAESPWGTFTVAVTVPLAIFMGIYSRWIRPGRVGEVSLIGLVGLILAVYFGQSIAASQALAPLFTFTPVQLCWILIGYGATAAMLPVWLLLAPRDYLSTFLKIGAIAALAIGVVVIAPPLAMPALTHFIDGSGPVWTGSLFPFLFITIACGAVSGFHALIASGTTPKLIARETDAPFIGYGVVCDIEPAVVRWGCPDADFVAGARQMSALICASSPAVQWIIFASNSRRVRTSGVAAGVPLSVHVRAHKPWRTDYLGRLPSPGAVIGDQLATDGLLAWRLRASFVHWIDRGQRPWWPRTQALVCKPLEPVFFTLEKHS